MVIGVIGYYCQLGAAEIGECFLNPHPNTVTCIIDASELPIRPYNYNPEIGGINCYQDTCETLGDGTLVEDAWGWAAACVPGWYGRMVLLIDEGVTWECRDNGGGIVPRYGEVYTADGFESLWFLPIDLLLREAPHYALELLAWQFVE